jgi:hypothetical protein
MRKTTGRGRPVADTADLDIRVTREQYEAVKAIAADTGLSRSSAGRLLISEALAQRARRNKARDL